MCVNPAEVIYFLRVFICELWSPGMVKSRGFLYAPSIRLA